ncbi:alpha-2A adrenergic receptor-like [Clytia hemisphaerica]|uniref:G-protein coupled receptors family 1 profile domain-containing protein n=1 Tax=Clytia hemisphaerica TaxID=252671 RepID=A0A7M5X8Q9_9CNID
MDTVRILKFISLLIIQLIAVFGNCLMIIVGFKCKSLRNFQNAFIFNMAFADFLQGALIMTSALINIYYGHWAKGYTACEIFGILKVTLTLSSVYSLSGTSVLRYFYVVKRTKRMNTIKKAATCIVASWLICIFLAMTPLFNWGILGYEDGKEVCTVLFHLTTSHTLVVFITGLFLNVIIMVVCYFFIFLTLHRTNKRMGVNSTVSAISKNVGVVASPTGSTISSIELVANEHALINSPPLNGSKSDMKRYDQKYNDYKTCVGSVIQNDKTQAQQIPPKSLITRENSVPIDNTRNNSAPGHKRARRASSFQNIPPTEMNLLKTVVTIVVVFICCWTPYVLFNMIRMFGSSDDNNIADTITMWLGFINSAVNPVIYGVMNKQFRNAMKEILCLRKRSSVYSPR